MYAPHVEQAPKVVRGVNHCHGVLRESGLERDMLKKEPRAISSVATARVVDPRNGF